MHTHKPAAGNMGLSTARRPKKACAVALLLGVGALTAGCASSPGIAPGLAVSEPVGGLNQQGYAPALAGPYILRPSDVLRVDVFREPELSLESVVVSADGTIALPLVGIVEVRNRTIPDVVAEIEQELGARYLQDPAVAINVIEYGSHQVTVEGAVEEPGLYAFNPGTRLSGGIALANGMTRVGQANEVAIFRQGAEGMEIAKFDFAAVRAGTMMDPVLMPGDRIVVGTDGLEQFWLDLLQALPVFALFTRI